ncbi:site-specific DNA-methyltransferase [Bacillus sp. OxB-1]|uniref:16S rRNA (guanine(966)-N(2))-methyltransferase RsmD n=1 Tax=Bacillus sp. (strain OxB-1) TaxID=98228 RepID=UPI0005821B74|nr:16S rRNA (guanine(966)-N(2))-methyltransferase RsmD [Bacillus sp. OxB-1]BAQ10408.1 site-specific DNA-methyltransferase [Bacillus sp. OxB-1]
MRIVAGSRRGIPLKSLPGTGTRPTSDKVKESLFNIIGPYFDGGTVVELFGGSGSLSLEALSRGAEKAIVFEKSPKACAIIQANVEKCRFSEQVHIHRADARNAVKILESDGGEVDLLFIDPPYAEEKLYGLANGLVEAGLLAERALIICEHEKKMELPMSYGSFKQIKNVVYGNTAITIFGNEG